MTATAHAIVAAAIAASSPNPTVAITLAFASHFVMDSIPHWDFGTNWRNRSKTKTGIVAIADTILGFTVAYLLFQGKVSGSLLFWSMVAGNLPDWMEAPYYIFFATQTKQAPSPHANFWEKLTYAIYKIENSFHAKAQAPLGIITQIAAVVFFLTLTRVW